MDKHRFNEISSSFSQKSILVIGDVMLDKFMWGKASRISPEAPVPIISIDKISHSPGGAANVALNLSKLSANVKILSIVLLIAVGIVLILGIGTLFKGGNTSKKYSNKLMQLRVLLQFVAIIFLVAFAYFFKN